MSFPLTILAAFALLFLLALGAVVAAYREAGNRAALATAEQSLGQAAETAAASTRALLRPVVALAAVLAELAPFTELAEPGGRETAALAALLGAEPAVKAVSVARAGDGALRQILRADALPAVAAGLPPGAAFALRERRGAAAPTEGWTFLGRDLARLAAEERATQGADLRQSPMFLQAFLAPTQEVRVSALHDLPLLGRPGLAVSRRVPGLDAVLGLDVTLEALATLLAGLRASPNSALFLFAEDGVLLAHQRPELAAVPLGGGRTGWTALGQSADPVLRAVWEEYAQAALRPGQTRRLGELLVRLEAVDELAAGGLAAPRLVVGVAAPVTDFTGPVLDAVAAATRWALLALLVGLLAIGMLAFHITRPLDALAGEAEAIRRLELAGPVPVKSRIAEVARLAIAMAAMKGALRVFGAYVPRNLVGRLMEEGAEARIGGARREVTVMFTDVENFTALAEGFEPEELMRIASAYFEEVTAELLACNATIDKYIGDAVMALWNAPQDDASHAKNACLAALRAANLTERLCERFAERGWPRLRTRFGVHTGVAVLGNVGSSDRMNYTAIGGMVNFAARLEGMNKAYGTRVLVSEATRAAAGAAFVTRPVDLVLAKGARRAAEAHELLGLSVADDIPSRRLLAHAAQVARLPAWRRLVALYREGRFAEAEALLPEAALPGDGVAALYAARLAALRGRTPSADWSPVLRFATK